MSKIKIDFNVYDSRYLTDPEKAICLEAGCETLNEARKAAKKYGENNVIERAVLMWVGKCWVVESFTIES